MKKRSFIGELGGSWGHIVRWKTVHILIFSVILLACFFLETGTVIAQAPGDYGDAPDGQPAGYPPPFQAVVGQFPTLFNTINSRFGLPGGHTINTNQEFLGNAVSIEVDATDPTDPDTVENLIDDDFDDGLVGFPCNVDPLPFPPAPVMVKMDFSVTLLPTALPGTRYLNVLIDLNNNGEWSAFTADPLFPVEWIVVDFPVNIDPGTTTVVTVPTFLFPLSPMAVWTRVALTSTPIVGSFPDDGSGWDGSGTFNSGEIEDFLLANDLAFANAADADIALSFSNAATQSVSRAQAAVTAISTASETVAAMKIDIAAAAAGAASNATAAAASTAEASASADAAAQACVEAQAAAAALASICVTCDCATACASAQAAAAAAVQACVEASASAQASANAAAAASASASAQAEAAAAAVAIADARATAIALALADAVAQADATASAAANASAAAVAAANARAQAIAGACGGNAQAVANAVANARAATSAASQAFALANTSAYAAATAQTSAQADAEAVAVAEANASAAAYAAAFAAAQATSAASATASASASTQAVVQYFTSAETSATAFCYCASCCVATLINLTSFTAQGLDGKVELKWETASEIDNAGFNIWRKTGNKGEFIKISPTLIPAEGSPVQGASYTYTDTNVRNGHTYYYLLEDIDFSGVSTLHGENTCTYGADPDCVPVRAKLHKVQK